MYNTLLNSTLLSAHAARNARPTECPPNPYMWMGAQRLAFLTRLATVQEKSPSTVSLSIHHKLILAFVP